MSKVVVRMVFGSHLYGTQTPDSDKDFKGIFIPSEDQVLLGRIPKSIRLSSGDDRSKNTADDVDEELYSLHHFIKLACLGETVALDMLHSRPEHWTESSSIWVELVDRRAQFYTKNLRALVGYTRRQAAKYGIKGSRLEEARRVLSWLREVDRTSPGIRLEDVWDVFPTGEHIRLQPRTFPETASTAEVCGKKLQSTAKARQYIETMERFVKNYGHRARLAEQNKGIDWKAISHAFRAAFQVRAILGDGDFRYPLPETEFILQVKTGELHYPDVARKLDSLIGRIEDLSRSSQLPEKVNRAKWDEWLCRIMRSELEEKGA